MVERAHAVEGAAPTLVIEPRTGWIDLRLGELWPYRELLLFLVWRDLKVRYKQSVLGVLWIVIQPLVLMVVFTVIFNRLLGVGGDSEVPYPLRTFAALLPWTYFANALGKSSLSLVGNSALISKVYFPRLLIPLAAVLPGLVDFGIAFVILLLMMVYYGFPITIGILAVPVVLAMAVLTALGVSLWMSALHVQYRDVQYVVPFLIQTWMYATPIIYPIDRIPEAYRWLYDLNPMVGVVESFRSVLLGQGGSVGPSPISLAVVLLMVVSGLVYFRRMERIFADVV
jgi:lipopolysaccharide transport system permease protein